ncbi:LOW QUALITY PROTEIN: uncharacterized protein ACR2FA_005277 [Aphomia sociella]
MATLLVSVFVYLGSLITGQGGSEREIRRTHMTKSAITKMIRIWRNRKVSNATKVRLVRTLVFPIFLYGSEEWMIRAREREKIDLLRCGASEGCFDVPWTARRINKSMEGHSTQSHEELSRTRPSEKKKTIKKKK